MDPTGAEQAMFSDTLYNDVQLPLQLDRQASAGSSGTELRLRAIALIEDSRSSEDGEERHEHTPALQRMEAKLDLVLALCASVIAQQRPALTTVAVRWSALGLRLDWPHTAGALPDSPAGITLQATDWLADPIQLPVSLLASEEIAGHTRLWLRFEPLGDALRAALERHVFRLHRRHIADRRRQR